jgi:hypothetical protein
MQYNAQASVEDHEEISTVFPGGPVVASSKQFIDGVLEDSVRHTKQLLALRYTTAVTGAMRWPWSQEAPIFDSIPRI